MQGYLTVSGTVTAELEEKHSRFIAALSHVQTEEAALEFLNSVRAANRTARHNVYAYCLNGGRVRYSDDGEPAKTAGTPVLGVLQHAGLTDCILVVTRYFGGILLGTGGLVRAYSGAAELAVARAKVVTVKACVRVSVSVAYPLFEQARRLLEEAGAQADEPVFADRVVLSGVVPDGTQQRLAEQLNALLRGSSEVHVSEVFYAAV